MLKDAKYYRLKAKNVEMIKHISEGIDSQAEKGCYSLEMVVRASQDELTYLTENLMDKHFSFEVLQSVSIPNENKYRNYKVIISWIEQ